MVDAKHKGPSFWDRLQPRERVLVMLMVGVFFLVTTVVMMLLRHKKLETLELEIADMREGLLLTRSRGSSYREQLASTSKRNDDISATPLAFASLVEEAQVVAEIKANNLSDKDSIEVAPGVRKRTYQFDMRGVTLEQLTKFLSSVESKEGHVVLTEALTIRSPSASEDRLNVDVVLATWERVEPEAEPEEQP